jgi:uncharacterized protein YbaP (TraB family)
MKSTQLLLIGFLVLLNAACKTTKEAKEDTKVDVTSPEMTAIPPGNQSLFWQIRNKNSEAAPSYLYGTIHVISSEDYFLGKNVKEKLSNADKLVMEVDLNNVNMNSIADAGLLPNNTTLRDYLSEEDFDFITACLSDSIGLSKSSFLSTYARMKPIFLQQLMVYKYLGQNPVSYETNFNQLAELKGMETTGLETFEEQLEFLNQIPLEEQFGDLVSALREWNETKQQFMDLLSAYKTQDLETLNRIIEEEMESPKMKEVLLNKRNNDWIPKLISILSEGNAFIAVGAGHLEGEFGVINLLRAAGYEVWPYPSGPNVE